MTLAIIYVVLGQFAAKRLPAAGLAVCALLVLLFQAVQTEEVWGDLASLIGRVVLLSIAAAEALIGTAWLFSLELPISLARILVAGVISVIAVSPPILDPVLWLISARSQIMRSASTAFILHRNLLPEMISETRLGWKLAWTASGRLSFGFRQRLWFAPVVVARMLQMSSNLLIATRIRQVGLVDLAFADRGRGPLMTGLAVLILCFGGALGYRMLLS